MYILKLRKKCITHGKAHDFRANFASTHLDTFHKIREAIFQALFYNFLQPNHVLLLILRISFKMW